MNRIEDEDENENEEQIAKQRCASALASYPVGIKSATNRY